MVMEDALLIYWCKHGDVAHLPTRNLNNPLAFLLHLLILICQTGDLNQNEAAQVWLDFADQPPSPLDHDNGQPAGLNLIRGKGSPSS